MSGNPRTSVRFQAGAGAGGLKDYALFMAVKQIVLLEFRGQNGRRTFAFSWNNALDYYRQKLYFEIEFQEYMQFKFYAAVGETESVCKQTEEFVIIGDIPIYVAMDSADTWANPVTVSSWMKITAPTQVAGCPPDGFSATGQLVGESPL